VTVVTKRTDDDHPLHRPPTLVVWDHIGACSADAARAAVLYERRHRFPMDEDATVALLRFAIDEGLAAALVYELTIGMAIVLREAEDRFVLVEANPFFILLEGRVP
jgi:hypothetical protein